MSRDGRTFPRIRGGLWRRLRRRSAALCLRPLERNVADAMDALADGEVEAAQLALLMARSDLVALRDAAVDEVPGV